MTAQQRPAAERVVPSDIYRRASTREFLEAVRSHVPGLSGVSDDRLLAFAYSLAWHESRGPAAGARARADGARFGYSPDDLADLLALGYMHVFPSLAPDVRAIPFRHRLGASLRAAFTRRPNK